MFANLATLTPVSTKDLQADPMCRASTRKEKRAVERQKKTPSALGLFICPDLSSHLFLVFPSCSVAYD